MKMKLFLIPLLFLTFHNTFANKALSPPNGQPPQCEQAYESAAQPKTADNVFNSLSSSCHYAGGTRVMHKVLTSEHSTEPTGVLFSCIGSDPNTIIFSCLFSTSFEDL